MPGESRGGVRHALRRRTGEADPGGRPRHGRRDVGRADHGRRRRDRAAARATSEKIQAVLRKYDVLLVADEVICGFWRTGNYWGSQTLDIAARHPDLRQGAVVVLPADQRGDGERPRVPGRWPTESHEIGTFGHGFTYSGHPVPAAVAIETLKIYDEIDIGAHVARRRRAHAGRAAPPLRRPSAGGRGARHRPDRARSSWSPTRRRTQNFDPAAEGRRARLTKLMRGERRDRPRRARTTCCASARR